MKREKSSTTEAKRKRLLMVLPLLVIPFLTMAFWAMGGGKGETGRSDASVTGLKTQLPDANLKEDGDQTKLGFYERADQDSAEGRRKAEMDGLTMGVPNASADSLPAHKGYDPSPYGLPGYKDPNEEKVYQKLAQINSQLAAVPQNSKKEAVKSSASSPVMASEDIDRLEAMLGMTAGSDNADPEMDRIDAVMEKILDIQHPERVKAKLESGASQPKTAALPVFRKGLSGTIGIVDTPSFKGSGNGFYSLSLPTELAQSNAIRAVVTEGRTLVSGAVIKLRLLDDVTIGGITVQKDNFVFGTVTLSEERLKAEITSLRYGASLYPVHLKVYDLDGMEGIFIPGAITREVAKNAAADASQLLEIGSYDPSLKAQAASAGVGAVKSLLNKKIKLTKVYVKPGYQVLLFGSEHH